MTGLRLCAFVWLTTQVVLGARQFQHSNDLPADVKYDYIIVGGGTAGAVVATRLGEDKQLTILAIEAGPSNEDIFETNVPGLYGDLERIDWNYTISPQPGANNSPASYSRAKVLGGCSSHNAMVYTRGSKDDYNRWASVVEDDNLSWDKMLPYILKSENWMGDSDHQDMTGHFDPSVHGKGGPLAVTAPFSNHTFSTLAIDAATELSEEFPFTQDINNGRPLGIAWVQNTINQGRRSSSATAYLSSTGNNVHVLLNTLVTRVVDVGGDKDFRGVEFINAEGNKTQLVAKKEVIVSAGVFNTPPILLHSGIGSKAELEPLGIKTLVDNPSVGKNFSDQIAVVVEIATNLPSTLYDVPKALAEWNATQTGPLAKGPQLEVLTFTRLPKNATVFQNGRKDPAAGENSPHLEMYFSGINPDPENDSNMRLRVYVANLNPVSRGSIRLASSDPSSPPIIDPKFFADVTDRLILREGVLSARRFFSASKWDGVMLGTTIPPANVTTDEQLDSFLRENVITFIHGVGSASMSPLGANWGVVDPDFSVKGTKNLRVVDASVMAYVPTAHTQAPTYALAELASDLIKKAAK